MKKSLILIFLFITSWVNAYSQNDTVATATTDLVSVDVTEKNINLMETTPIDKDWYKKTQQWRRYLIYRSVGWSFLGVGIPLTVGSFFGAIMMAWGNDGVGSRILLGTSFLGLGMTVVSIPLITLAYISRYKAKHMKLDIGMSHLSVPTLIAAKPNLPAFNFCLTF